MARDALQTSIEGIKAAWGPISTEVVAACRACLEGLLDAAPTEDWLASLRKDGPVSKELHRDTDDGFVLLAHTEYAGLYRPPHDHGRAWVVYAVQQGEVEMGTFGRVEDCNGRARLVKRDSTVVRPGQVQVYLPGDIHDTRCVSGPALLFRFTERDLKQEDSDGYLTRYVDQQGVWGVDPRD